MYDFNYAKVTSTDEAASKLSGAEDGKFMAGGMTLLPTLKQRLANPSDVIDLGGIADLVGITVDGSSVTIGAMTPHAVVNASAEVQKAIPALAKLAGLIGDPMVRNRGTIGGNLGTASPIGDLLPILLAMDATIVVGHFDEPDRPVAISEFLQGFARRS